MSTPVESSRAKSAESFLKAAQVVADLIADPQSVQEGPRAIYSTTHFPQSNYEMGDTYSFAISMTQQGAQAVLKIFEHLGEAQRNGHQLCESFVFQESQHLGMSIALLKGTSLNQPVSFDPEVVPEEFASDEAAAIDDFVIVYPDWVHVRAFENDDNECRLILYRTIIEKIAAGPQAEESEDTGQSPGM